MNFKFAETSKCAILGAFDKDAHWFLIRSPDCIATLTTSWAGPCQTEWHRAERDRESERSERKEEEMEEEEGEKKGEAFPNTGGRALCCHLDQRGPFIRAGTVSTPLTFGKGELECVHVQAFERTPRTSPSKDFCLWANFTFGEHTVGVLKKAYIMIYCIIENENVLLI